MKPWSPGDPEISIAMMREISWFTCLLQILETMKSAGNHETRNHDALKTLKTLKTQKNIKTFEEG